MILISNVDTIKFEDMKGTRMDNNASSKDLSNPKLLTSIS